MYGFLNLNYHFRVKTLPSTSSQQDSSRVSSDRWTVFFYTSPLSPLRSWVEEVGLTLLSSFPGLSSFASLVVQTVLPFCEWPHIVEEGSHSYLCLVTDSVSEVGIQVLAFSLWCLSGSFRVYKGLHPQFLGKSDCPQAQTLPPHQAHIWTKNTASSC